MQAMVSGVLLVAAFAAAAGACGLMAVRLYRVSGTAAKDATAAGGGTAAQAGPARRGRRAAGEQEPSDG